jgi:hypothetical protein
LVGGRVGGEGWIGCRTRLALQHDEKNIRINLARSLENHVHAVSLYMMAYNFVHTHHTLTKAAKGIHTTPAMAAGVTDRVWKVEDVVALLD